MDKKQHVRNDVDVLDAINKMQSQLNELNRKIDALMNRSIPQASPAQKQQPANNIPVPPTKPQDRHKGRPMFTAICADCKKECSIPFKPTGDRPVYCKDCFSKRKVITMSGVKFDDKPKSEAVSLAPVVQKEEATAAKPKATIKKKAAPAKKTVAKKKVAPKKTKKK